MKKVGLIMLLLVCFLISMPVIAADLVSVDGGYTQSVLFASQDVLLDGITTTAKEELAVGSVNAELTGEMLVEDHYVSSAVGIQAMYSSLFIVVVGTLLTIAAGFYMMSDSKKNHTSFKRNGEAELLLCGSKPLTQIY
jgi:p-aminobenzoyl-glutamate transporter AbgT